MKYERITNGLFPDEVDDIAVYRRLQELEYKIENGTLIELPLPIGADTWMVFNWHNKKLARVEKKKFTLTGYDLHWGENEFATKEEAEARLKELTNGKTN